jgi:hypothetical protein
VSSVVTQQQLDMNPLARQARSGRIPVRLCAYAYELLMAFMQGARLWLLMGLMNEHLRMQVSGGGPGGGGGA